MAHSWPETDEKLLKKLAGAHDKSPRGAAKRRSKIRQDKARQQRTLKAKVVARGKYIKAYKRRQARGEHGG